jgi:ankyrin repeat protein
MVEELLARGVDPDERNYDGETPLYMVCNKMRCSEVGQMTRTKIISLLTGRGASLFKMAWNGETPLHAALRQRSEIVVQYLLVSGAYISNYVDECFSLEGPTGEVTNPSEENRAMMTLHSQSRMKPLGASAIQGGSIECFRLLLQYGESADGSDHLGTKYVVLAAQSRQEVMVRFLIANGAKRESLVEGYMEKMLGSYHLLPFWCSTLHSIDERLGRHST